MKRFLATEDVHNQAIALVHILWCANMSLVSCLPSALPLSLSLSFSLFFVPPLSLSALPAPSLFERYPNQDPAGLVASHARHCIGVL